MAFAALGRRRARRTAGFPIIPVLLITLAMLSVLLFLYNFVWSAGSAHAKEVVQQFYELEQSGDFGSSWELFHSQMKEKFPKETYIQQRARILMQDLGAKTFSFDVDGTEHLSAWSMGESSPAISDVYRLTVNQSFLSVFGELVLRQEVYATEENGDWKLLWSYHDPSK